mgnify:CR=1 FL=1
MLKKNRLRLDTYEKGDETEMSFLKKIDGNLRTDSFGKVAFGGKLEIKPAVAVRDFLKWGDTI